MISPPPYYERSVICSSIERGLGTEYYYFQLISQRLDKTSSFYLNVKIPFLSKSHNRACSKHSDLSFALKAFAFLRRLFTILTPMLHGPCTFLVKLGEFSLYNAFSITKALYKACSKSAAYITDTPFTKALSLKGLTN